jgi:ligand-binding sensor domain-containing protein
MNKYILAGTLTTVLLGIALFAIFAEKNNTGQKTESVADHVSDSTSGSAQTENSNTKPVLPAGHPQTTADSTTEQLKHSEVDPHSRFTHFRVGPRNVKDIKADGKIIWVGTSGGVIRYDTRTDDYELLDTKSGLLANGIFHVSKIDGRLVAGTYGGGMAILNAEGKGWNIYNVPEGLADAFVYDVLKADNGDLWIATWSGVNRVRDGKLDDPASWDTFTVKNTDGGLPNDWVYALDKGKDGVIWLATEGGLARFDGDQWQHWQHSNGLGADYELVRNDIQHKNDPAKSSEHHARQKVEFGLQDVDVAYNPNYIVSLLVDHQGIVWCGTWGGGLARFDGTQWTNFTVTNGLPSNHVFMLYEDPQGQLWIGTSNGLARKDGASFTVYTTSDGLFSNNVFSMTTATDGSLWIGSYGGVARIVSLP